MNGRLQQGNLHPHMQEVGIMTQPLTWTAVFKGAGKTEPGTSGSRMQNLGLLVMALCYGLAPASASFPMLEGDAALGVEDGVETKQTKEKQRLALKTSESMFVYFGVKLLSKPGRALPG